MAGLVIRLDPTSHLLAGTVSWGSGRHARGVPCFSIVGWLDVGGGNCRDILLVWETSKEFLRGCKLLYVGRVALREWWRSDNGPCLVNRQGSNRRCACCLDSPTSLRIARSIRPQPYIPSDRCSISASFVIRGSTLHHFYRRFRKPLLPSTSCVRPFGSADVLSHLIGCGN